MSNNQQQHGEVTHSPNYNDNNNINNNTPPITALQDLIAGGVAGSVSVCVGHPFDTYKVRLQTSSVIDNKKSSSSGGGGGGGGISGLFRGMAAPLSTAAFVNAIIFSSYGESSRLWDDVFYPDEGSHSMQKDPMHSDHEYNHSSWQKALVCGSFAGAVQSLVICPSEHIKCRLQSQSTSNIPKHLQFKGPFDAFEKILDSQGIRGLYRGYACTICREIPAFGIYFSCYDFVKDYINLRLFGYTTTTTTPNNTISPYHQWGASTLAGGISGALSWAVIYPVDVIKTRIQTTPLDTPLEQRRIVTITSNIIREQGWRSMFRGLGVTIVRAFPVNGIVFPVYEFMLSQLALHGICAKENSKRDGIQ